MNEPALTPDDIALLQKIDGKCEDRDEDGGWIDAWFTRSDLDRLRSLSDRLSRLLPPPDVAESGKKT